MIRYLILLAFGYLLYVLLKGSRGLQKPPAASREEGTVIDDEMVKDPVCETYLPRSIAIKQQYGSVTHYFCSEKCAQDFAQRARTKGPET